MPIEMTVPFMERGVHNERIDTLNTDMKMRRLLIVGAFVLVGSASLLGESAESGPAGAGCATSGCHDANINTGLGGASLGFPEAGWVPGGEYTIVIGTEDSAESAGAELGAGAGELLESPDMRLESRVGSVWSVSRNRSSRVWEARWRAPLVGDTVWFPFSTVQSIAGGDWTWTGTPYWVRVSPLSVRETLGPELFQVRGGCIYWRGSGYARVSTATGVEVYSGGVRAGDRFQLPTGLRGVLFIRCGESRGRAIVR